MSITICEVIAQYRIYIHKLNNGEPFILKAIVHQQGDYDKLTIQFSHTYIPFEGSGPYYSSAYSKATSLKQAKVHIENFAKQFKTAFKVVDWTTDL